MQKKNVIARLVKYILNALLHNCRYSNLYSDIFTKLPTVLYMLNLQN